MEKPGYVCLCSDGMDMAKTTLPRIGKDVSGGLVYKCTGVRCHGSEHPSRLFFSCMHKGDSNLHLECLIKTLDEHYVEQEKRLKEFLLEEQQKLHKANQAQHECATAGEDKEDADKEDQSEEKRQVYDGGAGDNSQDSDLEARSISDAEENQTSSSQDAGKDVLDDGNVSGTQDSIITSPDAGQTSDHDARKQASAQNSAGKDIPMDADCKEAKKARTPFMHGFLQLDNTSKDNKNIIVLTLLAALVWFEVGGLQSFEVGFMEVGHTHLDCDQLFAELTKILGKEAVECLRDLLQAGEMIGAKVFVVTDCIDYCSWLKHLRAHKLTNNRDKMWYYTLLMKKTGKEAWDGDGVYMYYKNTCDDAQWMPVGGIKIFKAPSEPLPYPHLVVPRRPNLKNLKSHIDKLKDRLEIAGHGNEVRICPTFHR